MIITKNPYYKELQQAYKNNDQQKIEELEEKERHWTQEQLQKNTPQIKKEEKQQKLQTK